jgi:hypothetical protein
VALKDSGEELSVTECNKGEGRGHGRFLTSRRTPGTPRRRRRRGGSPSRWWRTSATAQRTAGERGQRKLGRERGNWGVSRVADVEAELTVAKGTAGLQRRRGDGLGTAVINGGGVLVCEQRGRGGKGLCRCANDGGERVSEALDSSGRGRGGGELHARRGRGFRGTRGSGRRLRGDGRADSSGPRAERAGKAGAGKAVALTSGPARAERGEGEGGRARGDGPDGPKGRGGGGSGLLSFFFYSGICFPLFFLFTIFDSTLNRPQIQINTSKYYAPNKSGI